MDRDLRLLPNGCIVEGPQRHDRLGRPMPRDIVVRLSYATPELQWQILDFLKGQPPPP